MKSAGNLIKTEIRVQVYTNEYYQSIDDITAKNWVPKNLQKLLRVLIQSEVKVQSIGQAIIKSSTRTALTPILFGLGVELDHVFASNSSLWDASVRLKTEDVQHQFALVASTDWNISPCGTCIRGKSCENNDVRDLIFISRFYKGSKRSEHTIGLYDSRTIAP